MEGLLRAFCVAQRRQFELAVNGVFWRTTVFFVLVLRQARLRPPALYFAKIHHPRSEISKLLFCECEGS